MRWVRGVAVLGLAGALVGVVPGGVSAVAGRARCRATVFVVKRDGTVSTIDAETRIKNPNDIDIGSTDANLVAVTPDGKTAFVTQSLSGRVSTIDVKTRRTKRAISVGTDTNGVAVTPDGKTVYVANGGSGTVSTIDVKTKTKDPNDIPVGFGALDRKSVGEGTRGEPRG